jgi:hypothetical protein
MSIHEYKKKIDAYIESRGASGKRTTPKAGLLAPTEKAPIERDPQQDDVVANVGDFIAAIRERRMQLKSARSKQNNGN